MSNGEDEGLRQELDRLTAECCLTGSDWEGAASRLIKGEAFPSVELMERIERLRSEWSILLTNALKISGTAREDILALPDPATSLADAVAFVQQAIDTCRREKERGSVQAIVLDRLDKVMRLEARDGRTVPGLSELLDEALDLARRVREATATGMPPDVAPIAEGAHRYCHLLALVEPAEVPDDEREVHLIECAASFGREVTKAAAHGQLALATGTNRDGPASEGSTAALPAVDGSTPEGVPTASVEVLEGAPAPTRHNFPSGKVTRRHR